MRSLNISLTTNDDIKIAGKYIPGSLPFGVILLHMMPAIKESYDKFAAKIAKLGLHTLAIDLRGHGESGGGNYLEFTHEQHQQAKLDVQAAKEYLFKQNPSMHIGYVGASIGANLSFQEAADDHAAFVIALSPGLNYRGVNAEAFAQQLPKDLPVFFVTAKDDGRVPGNTEMTQKLFDTCSSHKKYLKICQTGGHGTDILSKSPDVEPMLVSFIEQIIH